MNNFYKSFSVENEIVAHHNEFQGYARFNNTAPEGTVDLSTSTNKVEDSVTSVENDKPTDIEDHAVMFDKCSKTESIKNSFENPLFQLDIEPTAPPTNVTDGVQIVIEGKGKGIENPVAFIEESKEVNVESENIESVIEVDNLITVETDEVKNDENTVTNETDPLGVSNFIANQQSLEDSIVDVRKEEEASEVIEANGSTENVVKDSIPPHAEFVNPLSELEPKTPQATTENPLIETEVLVDTSIEVENEFRESNINLEATKEKSVTETIEANPMQEDEINSSVEIPTETPSNEAPKEDSNIIGKVDVVDNLAETSENLLVDVSSATNDTPATEMNVVEENTENKLVDFDSSNVTS